MVGFWVSVAAATAVLAAGGPAAFDMMPKIVPPIDREYTLRYLRRNTTIRNGVDREWQMMKEIISDFFIPIRLRRRVRLQGEGMDGEPEGISVGHFGTKGG
jgi:hypothetical protein